MRLGIFLLFIAASIHSLAAPPAPPPPSPIGTCPTVLEQIPYVEHLAPQTLRQQSLDIYHPGKPEDGANPMLVVFIHGGYWMESDDFYQIGTTIGKVFQNQGIVVASVRYRLAPANKHPTQVKDVAAAIAFLYKHASEYGFDRERIILIGHSSGAHIAALLALDPQYLGEYKLAPISTFAGVIAVSGIYDVRPEAAPTKRHVRWYNQVFGNDAAQRITASPLTHVANEAPPFLILAGDNDFMGFAEGSKKFAEALIAAGHSDTKWHILAGQNHFSTVSLDGLDNPIRPIVLDFLEIPPRLNDPSGYARNECSSKISGHENQ
jgi:acetyl esterase/lipase